MRKKLTKLIVLYVTIQIFFLALQWLAEKPLFNIISLENVLVSDASLNDLHYQLRAKKEDSQPSLSGKVILINTGSLSKDSFRLELAQTLNVLQSAHPKIIGIDHIFNPDTNPVGTQELNRVLNGPGPFLLAKNSAIETDSQKKPNESRFGNVRFPENQSTIRRYYSDSSSFGYQIAHQLTPNPIKRISGSTFLINYLVDAKGYFDVRSDDNLFYQAAPEDKQSAFLMIEAGDLLRNDSLSMESLRQLAPGRALLLGHMGNTRLIDVRNDIEDRHRVPCDSTLVNRERTMSGILIHANAVENILQPENRFYDLTNTWTYFVFKHLMVLLFMYFLLYVNYGKVFNILVLAILSFPILYLVLYLMTKNIYLEIGLTMLEFLVLEEVIEIFESFHHYILKLKRK